MPIDDSGISKPFDRILKAFVDEAPELFVRLLGIVPPDTGFRLSPLRPETAPSVIMPDFVASLEVGSSPPVLLHIEFQVTYHSGIPAVMARYGGSLAWQYGYEVLSLLVLLRRRGVPETISVRRRIRYRQHGNHTPIPADSVVGTGPNSASRDRRSAPLALVGVNEIER